MYYASVSRIAQYQYTILINSLQRTTEGVDMGKIVLRDLVPFPTIPIIAINLTIE